MAEWGTLDRAAGLRALSELRGVGTKVANCVLLFGYGHLDAFPIDVWIERALRESYFVDEPDAPLARLQLFAESHFGPYGGYAQQYLFHHARANVRRAPGRNLTAAREEPVTPIRRVRGRTR